MGPDHREYRCPQCSRVMPAGDDACAHCGWSRNADQKAREALDVSGIIFVKDDSSPARVAPLLERELWFEPAISVLCLAAIGVMAYYNATLGFLVALVSGWWLFLMFRRRESKGCFFATGLLLMVGTALCIALPCAFFLMCLAGTQVGR